MIASLIDGLTYCRSLVLPKRATVTISNPGKGSRPDSNNSASSVQEISEETINTALKKGMDTGNRNMKIYYCSPSPNPFIVYETINLFYLSVCLFYLFI